jgi:hypothetical protein
MDSHTVRFLPSRASRQDKMSVERRKIHRNDGDMSAQFVVHWSPTCDLRFPQIVRLHGELTRMAFDELISRLVEKIDTPKTDPHVRDIG